MITKEGAGEFFNQYASTMNNALLGQAYDFGAIMNSFADFVVAAGPMGVAGGKKNEDFAKAIREGIEFYKKIGIISMNISYPRR